MAFMKLIDPELRKYVSSNRLPEIYEALLSGLAIMCPEDPYQFIIDCLRYLKENGFENLSWDMFIDEKMRPPSRIISQSSICSIFEADEFGSVDPEQYEKAYAHYNRTLLLKALHALQTYQLYQQEKRFWLGTNMERAEQHYTLKNCQRVFETWKKWLDFRKGRQAVAFNQLQHLYFVYISRTVFEAWHDVTQTSKKTREYFERLARGDNSDEEEEDRGFDDGKARDDISRLPNKVAIKIFSFVDICDLAQCSRVCRSWKMLTQSTALLSRLDLTGVKSRLTDKIAAKLLLTCRPYLVHCNLRGCNQIGVDTFSALRECRNLQDLNLSEVQSLNDDLCKMMTDGCRSLLYLNLSCTKITDATLCNISVNLNNLQYLSLMNCLKFTDRGLGYLATGKGAKRLAYLDLSYCQQITAAGYQKLVEGCKGLHHLILDDQFTLDDSCVQHISANCPKLQSLSLYGSSNPSDETFKRLAANKRLICLKIDNNHKITDYSIKALGKCCSELRYLSLVDCPNITDGSLKAIMSCPLTVLNLSDCVRITDGGVKFLMEGTCGLRLQELSLTNCVRITDLSIVVIQKRARNLAYFNLCFCSNVTEAGLELLGQIHSMASLDISGCRSTDQNLSAIGGNARLRMLSVSQCPLLGDLGLQKFAQQCAYLERLDISHCKECCLHEMFKIYSFRLLITDGAIKSLAFCCRLLMHLNVAGCKLLTDLSIQYLSGVCRYLSFLDISGCSQITDRSLKFLKDGCRNLSTLMMLYCSGISKAGVVKLGKSISVVHHSDEPFPDAFKY